MAAPTTNQPRAMEPARSNASMPREMELFRSLFSIAVMVENTLVPGTRKMIPGIVKTVEAHLKTRAKILLKNSMTAALKKQARVGSPCAEVTM